MKKFVTDMILALSILSLQACSSKEYERKVTAAEVPPAVLQAFAKAYPNAEVRGYGEEAEGDEKLYEISFTNDGKRIDVAYASDGKLLEVEETIPNEDLPASMQDEIRKQFKQFEIKRVERIMKSERRFYEAQIDVKADGVTKRYELVFAEDGTPLEKEVDSEDEEE